MKDHLPSLDEFCFLRQKAENYLQGQKKQPVGRNNADLLEIMHELEVHQVELEMQNDELRRTRLFLENSRDDYFNLYEFAPVSFLTVNAKGIITRANIGATALLNVERHFLIKSGFLEFIVPEDRGRFCQLQKEVCASGSLKSCELTLQVKKGKSIPVLLEMLALHHEGKNEPHYLVAAIDISQQKHVEQTLEEIIHERTRDLAEMNQLLLRDITMRKRMEDQLQESEKRFRMALDAASDGLWDRNLLTGKVHYGDNWYKLLGYTKEDVRQGTITWENLLHPDDAEKAKLAIQEYLDGRTRRLRKEFRLRNKKGEWQWILSRGKIVEWDESGRPSRLIGTHTDITMRKNIELKSEKQQEKLEEQVRRRTAELEETNTALNVLLRKRTGDREALGAKIAENVSELIDPYLEKLKASPLSPWQEGLVHVLQESLHQLTSPFMQNMGANLIKFSPMELQVAFLVKAGKSSKEIAELLQISSGTVNIHRRNIRKKIGVNNQKANLQVALQAFMKE